VKEVREGRCNWGREGKGEEEGTWVEGGRGKAGFWVVGRKRKKESVREGTGLFPEAGIGELTPQAADFCSEEQNNGCSADGKGDDREVNGEEEEI
jgi:hypothetical protein